MINIYKATKDFGVTDQESPIYGSHVAGSEVDTTPEAAAVYVEDGQLELVSEGKPDKKTIKTYKVLVADTVVGGDEAPIAIGETVELDPKDKATKKLIKDEAIEEVEE